MNKTIRILLTIILITGVLLCAVACTAGDDIDYQQIEKIEVDETTYADGFLLSQFNIENVKLNVYYKSTVDAQGNPVQGEVKQIPVKESMVRAEDKGYLSVVGTHTINIVYGKFDAQFVLKLVDDAKVKYSVTFYDEQGKQYGDGTYYVEQGGSVVSPSTPTKADYDFLGWYDQQTAGKRVDLSNIDQNYSLYARFAPKYYTVSFYTKVTVNNRPTASGGTGAGATTETLLATAKVARGGDAASLAPSIPTIAGFSNGRWENAESMKEITADNMKFYAIYDQDTVLVTFNYKRNGSYSEDYQLSFYINEKADEGIVNPEREGFKFIGWYVGDVPVVFPYTITNEITFVAKYIDLDNGNKDLTYVSGGENECLVSGYNGAESIIVIPGEAVVDGVSKKIVGVKENAFINSTVTEFAVSSSNKYLSTENGVLYDFDKTVLFAYPNAKSGNGNYSVAQTTVRIANYAFYGATGLRSLTLNSAPDLAYIGQYSFANCTGISSLAIPNAVKNIDNNAFYVNNGLDSALTSITFGSASKLVSIGDGAFNNLNNLVSIALPAGLESIGEGVFYGCKNLRSVTAQNNVYFTIHEGGLYSADKTELYVYPANYLGSTSVELNLPAELTTIKKGAIFFLKANSVCVNSTVTMEEESIVSPYLNYVRVLAESIYYADNTFGGHIPVSILVNSTNDKLQAMRNNEVFGANVAVYDETIWKELPRYVDNYIYKLKKVDYIENDNTVTRTEAVILGLRNSSENVVIPAKLNEYIVTEIGPKAFYGDNNLRTVVLPATMVKISEQAFANAIKLTSVTLSAAVTTIETRAFFGCKSLATLVYPEQMKLEELGDEVFSDSAWYANDSEEFLVINDVLIKYNGYGVSADIPETIRYIAGEAFANKTNLTSVTINGTFLSRIDTDAFKLCVGLQQITLPASVVKVGAGAFSDCSNLVFVVFNGTNAKLPANINSAFDNAVAIQCTDDKGMPTLRYMSVEDNTTYRSENAKVFVEPYILENTTTKAFGGWFYDKEFTRMASFPITNATEDFILYAKLLDISTGTSGIKYALDGSYYKVVGYTGTEKYIVIPKSYKGKSVTAIADGAFNGGNCESIEKVVFPTVNKGGVSYSIITSVGVNAFDNTAWCKNYLGDFVIINDVLIKYKGSAETVEIPDGIRNIADGAFEGNMTLNRVTVPVGVTAIGASTFKNCGNLKTVVLPSSLLSIGAQAFLGCTSLKEINFQQTNNLYAISYDALENTLWLKDYVDDCIVINNILYKYKGVSSTLHVMNGIEQISDKAFYGNTYIETLYLPSSLSGIGKSAFENCDNLSIVSISDGSKLTYIEEKAFYNCTTLGDINLRICKYLTSIGKSAFENCYALSSLILPARVETIGESSFANSGIEHLVVESGSNLKSIGIRAFYNNVALSTVSFGDLTSLTEIGAYAFFNCIGLKSFTAKNAKVTIIGDYAFYNCMELKQVNINSSKLVTIGDKALYKMGYVAEKNDDMVVVGAVLVFYRGSAATVTIPKTIATIYNEAFINNSTLTTVLFESGTILQNINNKAFYNCVNLENIDFPSTIEWVGDDVVTNTKWYAQALRSNAQFITISNTLIKYNGEVTNVVLPESITAINKGAFDGKSVYNIELGSQVNYIADGAFDGMITSDKPYYKNINGTVTEVASDGWTITMHNSEPIEMCAPITTGDKEYCVYVPDDKALESYRLNTTWDGYSLKSINKHNITFSIDANYGAAMENQSLNMIYSEIALTSSEGYVFIGWYIDADCTVNVKYPFVVDNDMTLYAKCADRSIGSNNASFTVTDRTISRYSSISGKDSTVVIPTVNSDVYIKEIQGDWINVGTGGTHRYDSLTGTYVEETHSDLATHIYQGAFENDKDVINIYFADNSQITTIGKDAFKNCTSLQKIVLPSSITTIEAGAFANCVSLKEVVFTYSADAQITIKTNAFINCSSIRDITVTANVKEINDNAFDGCTGLMNIYVLGSIPATIDGLPFELNGGSIVIYVPSGAKGTYSTNWKAYADYLTEVKNG